MHSVDLGVAKAAETRLPAPLRKLGGQLRVDLGLKPSARAAVQREEARSEGEDGDERDRA